MVRSILFQRSVFTTPLRGTEKREAEPWSGVPQADPKQAVVAGETGVRALEVW